MKQYYPKTNMDKILQQLMRFILQKNEVQTRDWRKQQMQRIVTTHYEHIAIKMINKQ